MNAVSREAPERQEIEALLPWHAAGTLSRRKLRAELLVLGEQSLELCLDLVKEGVDLSDVVALPQSDGRELLRADVIRRQRHLSPRLFVSWRVPVVKTAATQ